MYLSIISQEAKTKLHCKSWTMSTFHMLCADEIFTEMMHFYISDPVADPGFSDGDGGQEPIPGERGGKNLLFGKIIAENCMKIKENESRVRGYPWIRQ